MRARGPALTLLLLLLGLAAPSGAPAHPLATSAVLLDVSAHAVTGEVRLPLDRLAVALGRPLTAATARGALRTPLAAYTARHVRATGVDGRPWRVTVGGGRVRPGRGGAVLVQPLRLRPPDAAVTDFVLGYDVIVHQLITHKAIATVRTHWAAGTTAHDPVAVGVFDWDTRTLRVDAGGGSWLRGVGTMTGLGVRHVAAGADHLLFLCMLLLPAPLVAREGRWRRRDDTRRSCVRTVHVVTAFALGHSVTLALAALGVLAVPGRVVESLVAVSILVSAVHALRPLVPRGEPLIAAGFGLVHGLAFASLLGDLGLRGRELVWSLLGFNLGIEVTQLLVVALVMPSLLVLSRTPVHGVLRTGAALAGVAFATGWLLERATLLRDDPFAGVSSALVSRPLTVAAALAVIAALARALDPVGRGAGHVAADHPRIGDAGRDAPGSC